MHGTAANRQTNWGVLAPVLANEGYCVLRSPSGIERTSRGRFPRPAVSHHSETAQGSCRTSSTTFSATGASKVDLIGHSQGTTVSAYYAKFLGGDTHVSKIVSIAPLWDGSRSARRKASGTGFRQRQLRHRTARRGRLLR
ncbi:esterase/lipase family protein [Rhodococcus sp. 3Y1]